MDKTCAIVGRMAAWVNTHPAPPLIFAAFQQARSTNGPTPYLGIVYQAGTVCPWWELGGRRRPFPAEHVAVIATHRGSRSDEVRGAGGLWLVTFDVGGAHDFDDVGRELPWDPVPVRDRERVALLYRRVANEFLRPGPVPTGGLRLKAVLLEFLAGVLEQVTPGRRPARPPLPLAVDRAVQFMLESYANPRLVLPAVATAAGLSLPHFGRAFRRALGVTPMRYLRSLRLRQGQRLLRGTGLRVREVAKEVGMADPLHFSRLFRRMAGISPTAYRRRRRA